MVRAGFTLLALPLLLGRATPPTEQAPSPFGDLAWLAGTWRAERDDGSFFEETWSAPRGDAMVGMFRAADADGRVTLYELMSLELEGPALPEASEEGPRIPGQGRGGAPQRMVFRLRHFDRGLAPWTSEAEAPVTMSVTAVRENELLLESPDRELPRTARYARDGERLRIELRGAEPEGRRMEFELRRIPL